MNQKSNGGSRQVQKNNHEFKHQSGSKSSKITGSRISRFYNRSHLMSEVKNFHCMVQASSGESYKPQEEDLVSDSSSEISNQIDLDEERTINVRIDESRKSKVSAKPHNQTVGTVDISV